MDLRGKRIEEGYTNLVTVEGDSVASSGIGFGGYDGASSQTSTNIYENL